MGYVTLLGAGGPRYDPATLQWLAQLSSAPSQTTVNAVNTFIKQCKTDGNWSLLDRFWLFAQDVQANARVSLANPTSTQITEVNSPSWVANLGYTSNGTTSYLNTNFNPTTNGVNYTLNSCSIGVYSRTNQATNSGDIGVSTGVNRSLLLPKFTDNNMYGKANNDTYTNAPVTDSLALMACIRDSSTHEAVYQRGVFVAGANSNSVAMPNDPFTVLGLNYSSSFFQQFSTRQIAIAFIGSGAITQSTFYTAVQNLATSIGFNV